MKLTENTATGVAAEGDWLTVAEFAAIFRISDGEAYAAIHRGEIPGVIRIGTRRGYRIPRASVAPYAEAQRVNAAV